jgi:lactate permease
VTGKPIIDRSRLTPEELKYEKEYPLWKALMPWILLIVMILALNLPKDVFNFLYRTMKLPIKGLTANGSPLDTRALWQAYTWIFVSIIVAIPFMKPTKQQLKDTWKVWLKRAPRPVFAAAIFFAIGEIMNMAGFSMAWLRFWPIALPSSSNTLTEVLLPSLGCLVVLLPAVKHRPLPCSRNMHLPLLKPWGFLPREC